MKLQGKVAVVAGASRGIALAFARDGADVACIATSKANAKDVAEAVPGLVRKSLALGCRVEDVP